MNYCHGGANRTFKVPTPSRDNGEERKRKKEKEERRRKKENEEEEERKTRKFSPSPPLAQPPPPHLTPLSWSCLLVWAWLSSRCTSLRKSRWVASGLLCCPPVWVYIPGDCSVRLGHISVCWIPRQFHRASVKCGKRFQKSHQGSLAVVFSRNHYFKSEPMNWRLFFWA